MKILYFAWLRQRTGVSAEEVELPDHVRDVAGLVAWLRTRGAGYAAALADEAAVRVAVDQEFATPDTPLTGREEVALFPPMTGG